MTKFLIVYTFIASLAAWPVYAHAQPAQPHPRPQPHVRPNIVIILADDLGWSDIGCFGNRYIHTPHLDRLAKEGMRFTNAYAPAPICSPSRAAILTGRSPARLHLEFVTKPDGSKAPAATLLRQPAFPRDLPLGETTLAEAIDSSYTTGFFGKWHLTQENDRYLGWGDTYGPLQQGFDAGTENRGSHPYGYSKEEKRTFGNYRNGEYPPDQLTEAAIDFLKTNKDRPFLLYYSMYYVHTPVQTRCRWLYDKYRERLGNKAAEERIHYAAFVETMDALTGRLLRALDGSGSARNTVVIFLSDNGGHPHYTDNAPLRGSKWNLYEGGVRVPMIVRWPEKIKPGTVCDIPVTGADIFPTVCRLAGAGPDLPPVTDGADLTPLFKDPSAPGWKREALYWHFPFYHPEVVDTKPQSSLREDNYKLIYFYEDQRTELYDLSEDPGEATDLSGRLPKRARLMKRRLLAELKRMDARFPQARK